MKTITVQLTEKEAHVTLESLRKSYVEHNKEYRAITKEQSSWKERQIDDMRDLEDIAWKIKKELE